MFDGRHSRDDCFADILFHGKMVCWRLHLTNDTSTLLGHMCQRVCPLHIDGDRDSIYPRTAIEISRVGTGRSF